MREPINCFLLAAGLGERLMPITDHIPKPLIPILGKPILQIILEKISTLPINKIGINLHHKKEFIENWINQSAFSKMVELFPEDPILGTGGALKNAEAFLVGNAFLVHNSDILSDIDLEKLLNYHLSSKNLVTLAVHDYPEFNNLIIDEKGYLIDLQHKILKQVQNDTCVDRLLSCRTCFGISIESLRTKKLKAFTGIAVYSPEFLKFLPQGASSVVDAWLKAVQQGYEIGTLDVSGCYWSDIGTPISYAKTVIGELRKNGEMVYIHPSINWCKDIELDGYVVIESESNPPPPPFSKGGRGGSLENCILGPDFKIDLSESEMPGSSGEADALLIGTGGSDRKYYRVKRYEHSAVHMKCTAGDVDFQRHIEYTRFFQRHSIPVPELTDVEPDSMSAFFEDLGDLSLYSWLKCQREQEDIEKIYRRVINILILIHTVATEHIDECPLLQSRVFDYEHLRWETDYFIERFVKGIRNIRVKNLTTLNDEFHRLAVKVDSFPKTVIHRDFQSQNIMITKGGIPRLLDYQGARVGSPAYDLASILWDPYYRLEDEVRERLLDYYIYKINPPTPPLLKAMARRGGKGGLSRDEGRFLDEMKETSVNKFNNIDFSETLLPCRLQRHMQALGAYGFLSAVKGKKYFLKHVPEGLRLLKEDASLSNDEYPELYNLIMGL